MTSSGCQDAESLAPDSQSIAGTIRIAGEKSGKHGGLSQRQQRCQCWWQPENRPGFRIASRVGTRGFLTITLVATWPLGLDGIVTAREPALNSQDVIIGSSRKTAGFPVKLSMSKLLSSW